MSEEPVVVTPVHAPQRSGHATADAAGTSTDRVEVRPDLSIVVPVLNELDNVAPLVDEIRAATDGRWVTEIVFVDDGSTDGTLERIRELKRDDPLIRIAALKRNWGKSPALAVGFELARAPIVFTMDGDLQDDPAEIPKFVAAVEAGNDLVCAWRVERQDKADKRLPSKVFNWLANRNLKDTYVHDFNCGFKAYRAPLAKALHLYGDMHRYVPILASMEGARITEVPVNHRPRVHGRSKYGTGRLARGLLDLATVSFLISFLERPLHFFGRFGATLAAAGVVIGAYLVGLKFLTGAGIGDRPLLTLAVLLVVVGMQVLTLGLLGESIGYRMKGRRPVEVMAEIED